MTFWEGTQLQLLWNWWNITTRGSYVLAFLIVAAFAIGRRGLIKHAARRAKAPLAAPGRAAGLLPPLSKGDASGAMLGARIVRAIELTSYHAVSITLAYLLMLVAMTFNVGMFLAVIVGETLGFLIFDALPAKGRLAYSSDAHDDDAAPIDDCCA